ncbi:MAG TPA: antitoxin Xre/MbcA/ParS toxin-binding domain-containing protein [Nitrosospira sp.]
MTISPGTTHKPFSASSVLGGERVLHAHPRSVPEWIDLVREGIPAPAIDAVIQFVNVRQIELSRALDIPERTLVRRKKEGLLNREESGKLLRLARIVERAAEVFEDGQAALDWMKSPNASLGGVTPLSMLDTDLGAGSVMDTLGRIEHGIFA